MKWNYQCKRCECPLDPVEMPYCDECKEEMAKEAKYRAEWALTAEQYREVAALHGA